MDESEKLLQEEKNTHKQTHVEVEALQQQLDDFKNEMQNLQSEHDAKMDGVTLRLQTDIDNLNKVLIAFNKNLTIIF